MRGGSDQACPAPGGEEAAAGGRGVCRRLTARAATGQDHLEPVAPNGGARVAERAAELRNQDGRTERPLVPRPRARVDVEALVAARRIILHGEVQGRRACALVLKDGGAGVDVRGIHDAAEILRGSPSEIITCVTTSGDVDVC